MYSKLLTGIAAGLMAGIVFGIMMTLMTVPTPTGGEVPMMVMVAQIVGSTNLAVGWIYHLFNSAVIGGIFGWLAGSRVHSYTAGLSLGAIYGFLWWVLGGLILMPMLLGMPAFAPLTMTSMLLGAIGSLVGHLLFGLILGGAYVLIHHEVPAQPHPV